MQTIIPAQQPADKKRIAEVSSILATAIIRLKTSPKESDVSLDLSPTRSVHSPRYHSGDYKR